MTRRNRTPPPQQPAAIEARGEAPGSRQEHYDVEPRVSQPSCMSISSAPSTSRQSLGCVPGANMGTLVVDLVSMTRMRVMFGAILGAGVLALAVPGGLLAAADTGSGGRGKLTLNGRVGPLRFDRSREADVIAFAGNPFAAATARRAPGYPKALGMGYDCREQDASGLLRVDRRDWCKTVFLINEHTHRLAAFFSSSRRYSFRGASAGMSTAKAARHIHHHAMDGCVPGFRLGFGPNMSYGKGRAAFIGQVAGGRSPRARRVYGGHVLALYLESNHYPVGLMFC
jgi:hypothetical protein